MNNKKPETFAGSGARLLNDLRTGVIGPGWVCYKKNLYTIYTQYGIQTQKDPIKEYKNMLNTLPFNHTHKSKL